MKFLGYAVILFLALGCQTQRDPSLEDLGAQVILDKVDTARLPSELNCRAAVAHFYSLRDKAVFWSRGAVRMAWADSMLQVIAGAKYFGLDPEEYHLDEIREALSDTLSQDRVVKLDVLLSDAFLALFTHVKRGRLDPKTLTPREISGLVDEESLASLQNVPGQSISGMLARIEPQAAQYQHLKEALKTFVADEGGHEQQGRLLKSISTKEILPHLQKDAFYLLRHNFDVLDRSGVQIRADTINWDNYSPDFFPFILRQREGSENSMGIIKFHFPNNYGVYLHDTNSKRLYERERRDLSHGCVRVNKAVSFAHYLVHEDDIYVSPEDLDQYLSLQQRLDIQLRKPIALKLEYFTAEVIGNTPYFYDDIYGKDSVMSRALYPGRYDHFPTSL